MAVHSLNKDSYIDLLAHLHIYTISVRVGETSILKLNHPDLLHAPSRWKSFVHNALEMKDHSLISSQHTSVLPLIHVSVVLVMQLYSYKNL